MKRCFYYNTGRIRGTFRGRFPGRIRGRLPGRFRGRPPRGFTLIEIVLTLAIFAIAVPSVGYIFGLAFREEANTSLQTQAVFLANSLMAEISGRRFRESASAPGNGPESGEIAGSDRSQFNDVDDYAAFQQDSLYHTAWGKLTPPRDQKGNTLTNFSAFSQYVTVNNVLDPTLGPTARASYTTQTQGSTNFKLVTVEISWDSGRRKVTLHKVFALP